MKETFAALARYMDRERPYVPIPGRRTEYRIADKIAEGIAIYSDEAVAQTIDEDETETEAAVTIDDVTAEIDFE